MEKKHVSLNLVRSYWANLGSYRERRHACAHNAFLDCRSWHHRRNHRRRRHPHVFAPDKRTISSRRPHFFHTGRNSGSVPLLEVEYPFPCHLNLTAATLSSDAVIVALIENLKS